MNKSTRLLLASISVVALAAGWAVLDSAPALAGQPCTYGTAMNTTQQPATETTLASKVTAADTVITPIPSGTGAATEGDHGTVLTEVYNGWKQATKEYGPSGGTAIKTTDSTSVIATKANATWQPRLALDQHLASIIVSSPTGAVGLSRSLQTARSGTWTAIGATSNSQLSVGVDAT